MKVPFSWLKQYVDIDVSAQELETKLFDCGFEVEELIDLGAEINKVVVGVVTECVPQEGTHLHICKVDCGDYGHDIQISTGASNVYAGMHTPAALDGSTLPGGIKIKAKPLMGIESNGMLCSGEELGLNEDLYPGAEVYGLLDLPKDTVPGTPIQQVVGLDDYIFDISITANRADCQSVLGIAREVAAVLNKLSLWHFFDVVCSADDEPRGKPHPAVYLTTLRKLNLNASQCLVIEDSYNGFCAAQAAGIPTAVVAEDSRQGRYQAAVGRYQTLPELLEALNAEPTAVA